MRWRFALLALLSAMAQAAPPPDISLLTFAPGEVYWQRFGHNALLLREADGRTVVYNYGLFDFRQKNFFLNFARGEMDYWLGADSLPRTLALYRAEGRSVREQRLNLDASQRQTLGDFLRWNARPENAAYRYDYFRDNCSTRVRDALDRILNGELRRRFEAQTTAHTYRSEAVRLMSPDAFLALGMDALMGPANDRPLTRWQHTFLPQPLMEALREATVPGTNAPLVASEHWLVPPPSGTVPAAPMYFTPLAITGALLGLIILGLAWRRRAWPARVTLALTGAAVSLVCGLGGVILLLGWSLSAHWGVWANQNLLLFNPLCLLLLPTWLCAARASWQPRAALALIAGVVAVSALLVLLLKPLLPLQSNLHWVAWGLPVHAALAFTVWRARQE